MSDEPPENFANHPMSINELRYERDERAEGPLWGILSPRDVLIQTLRQLDNGELEWTPTSCVIMLGFTDPKTKCTSSTIKCAGPTFLECLGLISRAMFRLNA